MTWKPLGATRASLWQGLDARTKLVFLMAVTYLALLWEDPVCTGALVAVVVALSLGAGIDTAFLRRVMRFTWPLLVLVLLSHGLWNSTMGHTILWRAPASWWGIGGRVEIITEGLLYGLVVVFRTLTLILVTPLTILTTDINSLVVGLVRMCVPYKVAFVLSATLRFVPLLVNEVNNIIEAQRLRGLALEKMNIPQRLRIYSRIAVPLILGAMVRSQQIEVALASRAFSGTPERTYVHESVLRRADVALIALCAIVSLAATWLRLTGVLGGFRALPY